MTDNRKLRVFLCHSSQDKPIVRELYQRLLAEGWIDPWLDEEKLLPGHNWDLEIEKAVEAADAVVIFLSNNSVTKDGYVQRELRFVLNIADEKPEGTVFVIPLRIEDCAIPRKLRDWQYVDYFPNDHQETVYPRIIESFRLRATILGISCSESILESKPVTEVSEIIKTTNHQNKLRILLVDDQEVIVLGLKTLLERHLQFEIVGCADSARDAIEQVIKLKPDVVVMDIRLPPGVSGIEACEEITARFPAIKVVMLTSYAEDELLFSAIRAGASGYVLKQIGSDDLVRDLEAIGRGESLLDPVMTQRIFQDIRRTTSDEEKSAFVRLSEQEKRVLLLVSDGKTNREIAKMLFLGDGTVRKYVNSIISKLGVCNRAEAATYAVKHRLRNFVS